MQDQDRPENFKKERSKSVSSLAGSSNKDEHKVTGLLEKYVQSNSDDHRQLGQKSESCQKEHTNEDVTSPRLEAEFIYETGVATFSLEDTNFELTAEYLAEKGVSSVDVVLAIRQAIDKRQLLIKELQCQLTKSKEGLQCLKSTNDEILKSCKAKEEQCARLKECLVELENKQSALFSANENLKDRNESYRYDNQKLSRTYECAMKELTLSNRKAQECEEAIEKLERMLRLQEEDTEKWRKSSEYYECELSKSRDCVELLNKMIEDRQDEINELRSKITPCETEQETEGIDSALKRELAKSLQDIRAESERCVCLNETINGLKQNVECLEMENDQLKLSLSDTKSISEKISKHNCELCQELSEMSQKNFQLKSACEHAEDTLELLQARLKELECQNANLLASEREKELFIEECNKQLDKEKCFSKDLELKISFLCAEIERQQLLLSESDSQIAVLKNHKDEMCEKLSDASKMDKRRVGELQKLNMENCRLRDNLISLKEQYDKSLNELYEKQQELIEVKNRAQRAQEYIVEINAKHKCEVEKLELKLKNLNCVWEQHVNCELDKLKVQYEQSLKYNCENYIKLVKETDVKTYDTKDHDIALLMEEITVVKRQLELSSQKLEEALLHSQSERREVIESAMHDRQRLLEKFSNINITGSCYGEDFEERLQSILKHYICDTRAFEKLEARNKNLKERIKKLKEINRHYKSMEESLHSLTIERDQLKADLSHVKGLIVVMETTNERLMKEAQEFKKSIGDLSQELDRSHKERIALVKQLGQRNAYIEFLNGLITQLKCSVKELEGENKKLLTSMYSYEHEKHVMEKELIMAQKSMADMKSSLECATQAKNCLTLTNTGLVNQVSSLKGEVCSLKAQMETKNERLQLLHDEHSCCLENQRMLRERINELQLSAPVEQKKFEEAKSEIEAHKKQIMYLHRHIDEIIEEQKSGKDGQRDQLTKLTNEVKDKKSHVKKLTEIINAEKGKLKGVRSCLAATDEAFYYLVNMFDAWCTSLSKTCLINYRSPLEEVHVDHRSCQDTECQLCERIEQLRSFETIISNLNERIQEAYSNECVYRERVQELKLDLAQLKSTEDHEKEKLKKIIGDLEEKLEAKNSDLQQLEDQILKIRLSQTDYSNKFVNTFSVEEHNKFIVSVKDDLKRKLNDELSDMKTKTLQVASEKHKVEMELQECQAYCVSLKSRVASLEGEIESLKRFNKDFHEKEVSYIEKISDVDKTNQKLIHELTEARLMLANCQNRLDNYEQSRKSSISSETADNDGFHCSTECPHATEFRKNNEIAVKTLQEKLDSSRVTEHKTRLDMIDLEKQYKILQNRFAALESEKASLEGWVSQLQDIFKENKLQYCLGAASTSDKGSNSENEKNNIDRINTLKEINNEMASKYHFLKQQYDSVKKSLLTGSMEEKFSKVDDLEKKIFDLTKMINDREDKINQLKCELNKCKCNNEQQSSKVGESLSSIDRRITACVISYADKSTEVPSGGRQAIVSLEKKEDCEKVDSAKSGKGRQDFKGIVSGKSATSENSKIIEEIKAQAAKIGQKPRETSIEKDQDQGGSQYNKKTKPLEFNCQDCDINCAEKSKDYYEAIKTHETPVLSPKKKDKKSSIIRMWNKSKNHSKKPKE